ncbi:MAG: rhodanese-like domain-containing protein [Microcoleaceae cyanobacterium]
MTSQPSSFQSVPEIDVVAVGQRLSTSSLENLQLIDVREPEELALAQVNGFTNLPLSQYAEWSEQMHTRFDTEVETWVMCHHGMRSAQMCQWLMQRGFQNVKNITGGIDAYSILVDSTVPRY